MRRWLRVLVASTLTTLTTLASASPAATQSRGLTDPITGNRVDYSTWSNSNALANQMQLMHGMNVMQLLAHQIDLFRAMSSAKELPGYHPDIASFGREVIQGGNAKTTFQPAGRSFAPEYFVFFLSQGPEHGAELFKAQEALLEAYRAWAPTAPYAIALDDVADAMAFRTAQDYELYARGGADLTSEQFAALKATIRAELLQNGFFQGLSDSYKQLQQELSVIQGVYTTSRVRELTERGDQSGLAQLVQGAYTDLREMGLALECWQVTDTGLTIVDQATADSTPQGPLSARGQAAFPSVTVNVEIARTPAEQAKGAIGRPSLGERDGILFAYDRSDRYAIWMKGMNFPLDMLWIENGRVVDIGRDLPPVPAGTPDASIPRWRPDNPARYILAVNAGFAKRHGIEVGTPVQLTGT